MKFYAASKYLFQVREKNLPAMPKDDPNYGYFNDRHVAVLWLIEREERAIALLENQAKQERKKLAAFQKKQARA